VTEENSWIKFDGFEVKRKEYRFSIWDKICMMWNRYVRMTYQELKYRYKRSIGRVFHGVSKQDCWNLDHFLAEVIYHGLCQLQLDKHGYSDTLNPETGKYEEDEKRWDLTLQKMINGFSVIYRVTTDELVWGLNLTEEQRSVMGGIFTDSRVTTREEEKIAMEAFDLFKEHFFSLWD